MKANIINFYNICQRSVAGSIFLGGTTRLHTTKIMLLKQNVKRDPDRLHEKKFEIFLTIFNQRIRKIAGKRLGTKEGNRESPHLSNDPKRKGSEQLKKEKNRYTEKIHLIID